jgi:hypothetical protein
MVHNSMNKTLNIGNVAPLSYYLANQGFSNENTESWNRSSLTDRNLNDCMRVAVTKYTPSHNKLAEEIQCKVSHLIPLMCSKYIQKNINKTKQTIRFIKLD